MMVGRNKVIVSLRQMEISEIALESRSKYHELAVESQLEDYGSLWESKTEDHEEQDTVLPLTETDHALSPSLDLSSASTTDSVRKSMDSGFVLESDPEDIEDGFIYQPAIEIRPAPLLPVISNLNSSKSKSLKLETFSPHSGVHCSKRIFEAVLIRNKESIANIQLAIVGDWSACAMTTVIWGTDCFNHYYCPFPDCNKRFRKKYNIRSHMAAFHHGPFYCPRAECGKIVNSKVSKMRHIRKSAHDRQCCSAHIDSYHSKQIQNFCLSMCKKIENAPDFWMVLLQ